LLPREQFKKEEFGMTSPGLSKPRTARGGSFLRSLRRVVAHWRAIVLLLMPLPSSLPAMGFSTSGRTWKWFVSGFD